MNDFNYIQTCPECGKQFKVYEEDQIPGFRFPEDMVCPYCKHVCRTSLEYEFTTEKMEG